MISIIVPVYNAKDRLAKMIDSLLNQTYPNKEIILIDDGSTDGSADLCEDYKNKYPDIVRAIHKENEGVAVARNVGLDCARGEYIAWCDSDDYMNPDMLERLYDEMQKNNADIVMEYFNVIQDGKEYLPELPDKKCIYANENFIRVFDNFYNNKRGITTVLWNKLYRKKLFDHVRFMENVTYEDKRIMHHLMNEAGTIVYLNSWGYNYVLNDQGITRNRTLKTEIDDYNATLDRYYFILETADLYLMQQATNDLLNKIIDVYAFCKEKKNVKLCDELTMNFKKCYRKIKLSVHWKINMKFLLFYIKPDLCISLLGRGSV